MSNARFTSYSPKGLSIQVIKRLKQFVVLILAAFILTTVASYSVFSATSPARPKTIVISLDGATPTLVNKYLDNGAIAQNEGLGVLKKKGALATQNITV